MYWILKYWSVGKSALPKERWSVVRSVFRKCKIFFIDFGSYQDYLIQSWPLSSALWPRKLQSQDLVPPKLTHINVFFILSKLSLIFSFHVQLFASYKKLMTFRCWISHFFRFLATAMGPRQLTANKLTAKNADWLRRAILNIFLLSPEPSCPNPHFVTKSLRRNQWRKHVTKSLLRSQFVAVSWLGSTAIAVTQGQLSKRKRLHLFHVGIRSKF